MKNRSSTHLVLIPAFNPGRLLVPTVAGALEKWDNVWVVVDASTDGSHEPLLRAAHPGLRVIVLPVNGGKGRAVQTGAREAVAAGFTHALVMDADGQHPADRIGDFMEASVLAPDAVICGKPVFGPEAPRARLYGRKLSVGLVHLETGGRGAADPLFGFRVYPLAPLLRVLEDTHGGRRYDFDPEVAVRLAWQGAPAVNLDAACVYVSAAQGGVSHFRYLRDNVGMVAMHLRLISALLLGRKGGARQAGAVLGAVLLGFAAVAVHAVPPGPVLTPASAATEWKPLLAALAAKGGVQATFTERRYFPFRREPTLLRGILRVSPERGLSLQYTEPEANILIADSSGLLLRDSRGHSREMPAGSHEAGAISSLLPIMRFDLQALFPRFEIRALRTEAYWRFEFTPKDPETAGALGMITVDGSGEDVRHLEFRHSEKQRVEIDVEGNRGGIVFTPAEVRAFFR